MDVRLAYAQSDFEWDNLRKISERELAKGSTAIMRQTAAASFAVNFDSNSASSSWPLSTDSSNNTDSTGDGQSTGPSAP